jgi:predicted DNA-binding transcriptional regulator AlpA
VPSPPTLADQIEKTGRALRATDLASLLSIPTKTIYRRTQAGQIPCIHIGACVRYDPFVIARWLRGDWKPTRRTALPHRDSA